MKKYDVIIVGAGASGVFESLNSLESIKSLSPTDSFSLFGTSIPTAALPGIGASILISGLASAIERLSERETIFESLTPGAG